MVYVIINKIYKIATTPATEKSDTERIEKAMKYLAKYNVEAQVVKNNIELN
jgi:hypothetical protein